MRLFTSIDEAAQLLAGEKKWDRMLEAAEASSGLPAHITYSVGDSLTWRGVDASCVQDRLTASRRYLPAVHCRTGWVDVEVASTWSPAGPYSDLSDRQAATAGQADREDSPAASPVTVRVPSGGLLLVDIAEASRIAAASPDFAGVLMRITVEGRSFHNK